MPPKGPISHRFAAPSGVTLAVHTWGGDGAPVLLAHPTGFHGVVWAPIARRLAARGRRVWSFDFRGHGDSDRSPSGYGWGGFADDVLAVAHHLGVAGDPALLAAGHSKGAAALLLGSIGEPETFSRVWCYEPVVFPRPPGGDGSPPAENPLSLTARRRRAVWDSPEQAFASFRSRPPLDAITPEALRAYVDHGLRARPDGRFELKCLPGDEATMYAMGATNGVFERLPAVWSPVLVACGEEGPLSAAAAQVVERLPDARLEVWPGHGHFGPLADPDHAVASMLTFAAATTDPNRVNRP